MYENARWGAIGAGLVALLAMLSFLSPQFGYETRVFDMPVFTGVALLAAAGALYLALLPQIRSRNASPAADKQLFFVLLAVGLAMRLVLLPSEPMLEDDYQRYLWDGAVSAHGLNPYALTPGDAKLADPTTSAIGRLALSSGKILGRVNHDHLKTVYPPLAQIAFAVAHWIAPWSLLVWRIFCLACDAVALGLILVLLRQIGRPDQWVALYWWNPLAAKEIVNSAHMDVLLLPLILGALVLAARARPALATASLVAAAGVKLWPALLLPLIWRPLLGRPVLLGALAAASIAAACLMAWPVIDGGIDESSGLVAYARNWSTNSALFPQVQAGVAALLGWMAISALEPSFVARALIGLVLISAVLALAARKIEDPADLVGRSALFVALLLLLLPAQFPWYYLWLVPFLPFVPAVGLSVLTLTLPLYYLSFYYIARDSQDFYNTTLVWLVWLPAWMLLLVQDLPHLRAFLSREPR